MASLSGINDRIRRATRNKTGLSFSHAELKLMAEVGLFHMLAAKEADEIVAGLCDHEHPAAITPPPERAYSVATLAAHWGCSDGLVRNLIKSGELKSWRFGNLIRISREAVAEFEANGGSDQSTK